MTDRIAALTVVLADNIRDDDAAPTIAAIRCLRHVIAVEPIIEDSRMYVAQERARQEYAEKLLKVLYPKPKGREV